MITATGSNSLNILTFRMLTSPLSYPYTRNREPGRMSKNALWQQGCHRALTWAHIIDRIRWQRGQTSQLA